MRRVVVLIIALMFVIVVFPGHAETNAEKYEHGKELVVSGAYDDAVTVFSGIERYEDSSKYLMYIKAVQLAEAGQYSLAISTLTTLGDFLDSPMLSIYYQAQEDEESGETGHAIELYSQIATYKDSLDHIRELSSGDASLADLPVTESPAITFAQEQDIVADDAHEAQASTTTVATNVCVGDYITFGTYPQTAQGDDETPIEWLVLDIVDNKAFVVSKYGLDYQKYNEEDTVTTWETCSLRSWLNDTFLGTAFSSVEERSILLTDVDNSASQGCWNVDGGTNTHDKIFLLSFAEVRKYFDEDMDENLPTKFSKSVFTEPTKYAIRKGAWKAGTWCSRSPGTTGRSITSFGSAFQVKVNYNGFMVRPAMWLDLNTVSGLNSQPTATEVLQVASATTASDETVVPSTTLAPAATVKPTSFTNAYGTSTTVY